ncbi:MULTISPECIES: DNA polymerase III subunit gamma/tau [Pontibacillus]|uniref:DNA-directed DNA polymerase n=1 Tax=Pontibacillus chungwhensis TaxID=265426 RepID=A0ABY8UYU5_9BACI|nr:MULTISPECIES: DNA polymerase III subunit gamma/tau [Pontibacillus]MCD5325579.1 DNA polymerase III subunit gamma/tau [Pontibacillus sp. HN14]WIF98172.1 DNA polymerase III subunit gamma/tau [Pontibacillus chungwhensis]
MSYQALYRVWRPKNFSDVVGQTHITRTLQNATVQNKFSHAYLFSGPRGTGKTSAAKIFAKAVNCERSPVKEPCNECSACLGIQDGSISDVIEIDAASNNGVEQIRDIRDKVKYAPSSVPYKVYIVDEVHMLSIGAFNALLKTLEEPPKHVIFILATTEPHKIPLTIISRCQRFDFKRISQGALVERMEYIVDREQIGVTREALEAVALSAEGGMRDALSLLDQAISYSEDQVAIDDVLAVTGSVSQQKLATIVETLQRNEVKETLQHVDSLIQEGKDPGRFIFDLIYYLRDLLLYQSAPGLEDILERAIPDEAFKQLSSSITADWIQQTISVLNQCQQEMKWTNSPKVFIEIAMLNICEIQGIPKLAAQSSSVEPESVQKLQQQVEALEKRLATIQQQPAAAATSAQEQKRPQQRANRKNSYKIPFERIRHVMNEASKQDLQTIKNQWASFMDSLRQTSPPAHARLMNSTPRAASDNAIVLSFKYEIHCSLALENQAIIQQQLAEFMGKEITIIPIPETNWQELREEYVQKQRQQDQPEEESQQEDPLIAEARKLVGDELLDIQED